jgi:hypothetical protein
MVEGRPWAIGAGAGRALCRRTMPGKPAPVSPPGRFRQVVRPPGSGHSLSPTPPERCGRARGACRGRTFGIRAHRRHPARLGRQGHGHRRPRRSPDARRWRMGPPRYGGLPDAPRTATRLEAACRSRGRPSEGTRPERLPPSRPGRCRDPSSRTAFTPLRSPGRLALADGQGHCLPGLAGARVPRHCRMPSPPPAAPWTGPPALRCLP